MTGPTHHISPGPPPQDVPRSSAKTGPGTHGAADAQRPGWAEFLLPGRRVVVRYVIDPRTAPAGERMTDALGSITAVDEASVTVMTRRGEVQVPRLLIVAAKEVPPPPTRRADGTVGREP